MCYLLNKLIPFKFQQLVTHILYSRDRPIKLQPIKVNIHVMKYIHIYIYIYIVRVCVYMYIYIYIYICIHTYCVYIYIYIYMYIISLSLSMHIYIYIYYTSPPEVSRSNAVFGWLYRLGREEHISQNWLNG